MCMKPTMKPHWDWPYLTRQSSARLQSAILLLTNKVRLLQCQRFVFFSLWFDFLQHWSCSKWPSLFSCKSVDFRWLIAQYNHKLFRFSNSSKFFFLFMDGWAALPYLICRIPDRGAKHFSCYAIEQTVVWANWAWFRRRKNINQIEIE